MAVYRVQEPENRRSARMRRLQEERTVHITARVPVSVYLRLKKHAEGGGGTRTELVVKGLDRVLPD